MTGQFTHLRSKGLYLFFAFESSVERRLAVSTNERAPPLSPLEAHTASAEDRATKYVAFQQALSRSGENDPRGTLARRVCVPRTTDTMAAVALVPASTARPTFQTARCPVKSTHQRVARPGRIVRCEASESEAEVRVAAPTRRGFLGTAAAGIMGALPWTRDLAAAASGEPAYAPDAVTLQNMFWSKASKAAHPERWYPYWWALPLAPYGSKTTTMLEAVPDQVWCFDQLQGLLDVLVNVRMTVIALEGGGLWVHNPVAPTAELMSMLAPIVDKHGPVKHIVCGSAAIEHKIYSGPFSKKFPSADVWLPPKNWSFPVDVPLETYVPYYPRGSPQTLPEDSAVGAVPWGDEIEHSVLQVGGSSLRGFTDPWFVDTAFYHKKSKTMLVTDVVLKVSEDPVPVAAVDPEPLLVRGMEAKGKMLPNTPEARSMGWGKTVLFGLLFQPTAVSVKVNPLTLGEDLLDSFTWDPSWKQAFDNLCAKPLFVPPILQVLAFPRRRDEVRAWTERVASWDFERIIPSHLDGPINAGPKEFAQAVETALTTDGYSQFGSDIDTLAAVEKLSRDIKSLEEPRPLTDTSPFKYYTTPPPPVEEAA